MIEFKIDENKCIKCGVCAIDCPINIITMEYGFPHVKTENEVKCMGCQHCLAVCPTGALSIFGINPEECSSPSDMASDSQMEALIRNRRTVRQFKQCNIDAEKLDRLIKVTANAPTGKNNRKVNLHIIDDITQMKIYVDKVYDHISKMDEEGKIPEPLKFFGGVAKMYHEKGIDLIFRGAPNLVVGTSDKSGPTPLADGYIALTYMELMAASMGLGVVWVGFLMYVYSFAPELMAVLGVNDDQEAAYALLIGEPSVKYYRGVVRDEIAVNRVRFTQN